METSLKQIFGFNHFRNLQQQAINSVIRGQDTLVVMPTGAGKSLCFQLPAITQAGVGIIISPLISLMKDQVTQLKELGIRAAYLNSSQRLEDMQETVRLARHHELDLLYVSPERALQPSFAQLLAYLKINLFAIDEAHCVSTWGHDFRSEYQQLPTLFGQFPDVTRVALTATADQNTRKDIIRGLSLRNASLLLSDFDRPNLFYQVSEKTHEKSQIIDFLNKNHQQDSGIIYCGSRQKANQLALWLQEQGRDALPYHAGLSIEERATHQERFLQSDDLIIVATIAFGMGIHKPNVRFIIHVDLPKSLEAYYQETGRAGRDGLQANCLLLYSLHDLVKNWARIRSQQNLGINGPRPNQEERYYALLTYCEATTCRRKPLLSHFEQAYEDSCHHCDNCLNPQNIQEVTEEAQKLLSCIYRGQQQLGFSTVVDVLIGKNTKKIRERGLNQLSTYGIGQHWNELKWRQLVRSLLIAGRLQISSLEKPGILALTPSARPILRGEQAVLLGSRDPNELLKIAQSDLGSLPAIDRQLWHGLRLMRKKLASSHTMKTYNLCSDKALLDIVIQKPKSVGQLKEIDGLNIQKAQLIFEPVQNLLNAFDNQKETEEEELLSTL